MTKIKFIFIVLIISFSISKVKSHSQFTIEEKNNYLNGRAVCFFSQTTNKNDENSQYYSILDKCVKECNGMLVSIKNVHQLSASFTSRGYAALTDEKIHSEADMQLHKVVNIKWDHVVNLKISTLTFQYSCICIEFAEGFSPTVFWNRTTNYSIKSIQDPMDIDPKDLPYDNYFNDKKKGRFSIVVKKEQANKCIEAINHLISNSKEKNSNLTTELTRNEKWSGEYLEIWHTDSTGIKQGRYEMRDITGKLISYGDYKDNVKVGKWLINGITNIYGGIGNQCSCSGYHEVY